MKKIAVAIIVSVMALVSCGESQIPKNVINIDTLDAKKGRLTKTFGEIATQANFMGSVALMHESELIYAAATGYDDISRSIPSTVESQYLIGSISKTYTATLTLMAVEENKLSLNQTIASFFPKLINAEKIRIVDLLQHSSGIGNYTKKGLGFSDYRTQIQSRSDMLTRIVALASDFEPQSDNQYSNSNYFLLAIILEMIYDTSFDSLLKEKIASPLALSLQSQADSATINQHSYQFVDEQWQVFPATHLSTSVGAGDISATPSDVAKFYQALFSGQLLTKASLAQMTQISNGYGLGLVPMQVIDKHGYGHGGKLDAYNALAVYFPEEKLTFVLVSNGSNDNFNDIYQQLLTSYFNQTRVDIPISSEQLLKFTGTYQLSADDQYAFAFGIVDGKLARIFPDGYAHKLRYEGNNRFYYDQVNAEPVIFNFIDDGARVTEKLGENGSETIKSKLTH